MYTILSKRALFGRDGFTLLELLITISLIGLIAALLTPKLIQAKEESLRQVTRQQAKLYEKALAEWFSAQPSAAVASKQWDSVTWAGGTDGFASPSAVLNELYLYLSLKIPPTVTAASIYTPEMKQLPGTDYIGGNTGKDATAPWAHLRFYWQLDDPLTTDVNERLQRSPKVVVFLPVIP